VIEQLWSMLEEFASYIGSNFDPVRDLTDVLLVTFGIYWLLLLIRGTRAVQILVGLLVLLVVNGVSNVLHLVTLRLILDNFLGSAVIIMVIVFQQEIRRALARVGRGFFSPVSAREESQMLEEIVRSAQKLAPKRIGALIVLERDTQLDDQIESGVMIDATVTKELITSIFLPRSPLHDGALIVQGGRIAQAGCILPLTLREDLPEGVGTRHRAAVGITEETDAVVIVVSEETGGISIVLRGEMAQNLEPPVLRVLLRDILSGERDDLRNLPLGGEVVGASREPERTGNAPRTDSVRSAG